jgi:hypothetical protein
MRILLYILLAISMLGCKNKADQTYRVSDKDSANFTVAIVMLYPDERLLVKVNNEVLLDTTGGIPGSLDSRLYFKYPKKISTISASGVYNGTQTFNRFFKDTLSRVPKLSLVIPFPMPKATWKGKDESDNRVPMESTERNIVLLDDTAYPKQKRLL